MSTAIQPLSPVFLKGRSQRPTSWRSNRRTEPVFCPSRVYCDDRGWSLMNELQGVLQPEGQVNYSVQFPGVIKAWHRHAEQTDFWMVVQGQMKVGIHRSTDQTSWSCDRRKTTRDPRYPANFMAWGRLLAPYSWTSLLRHQGILPRIS